MGSCQFLDPKRKDNSLFKNLDKSNLIGRNFEGENLVFASIRCACLSYTIFIHADLRVADLWGSKLNHADFTEANLEMAHLSNVDLTVCDLRWANLEKANLQDASLHGARLENTNLKFANFKGTDLRRASFEGAIVEDAIFENNIGLTESQKFDLIKRGAIFIGDKRCKSRLKLVDNSESESLFSEYKNIDNCLEELAVI